MDKSNKKTVDNPIRNKSVCSANSEKTATNNQWVSTGLDNYPDKRERRDGPGGENADN